MGHFLAGTQQRAVAQVADSTAAARLREGLSKLARLIKEFPLLLVRARDGVSNESLTLPITHGLSLLPCDPLQCLGLQSPHQRAMSTVSMALNHRVYG